MTAKRILIGAGALTLVVVLAIGLLQLNTQSKSTTPPSKLTRAQMQARLNASPPRLAALHSQASDLLDGGEQALRARLAALKGYPVVINTWASWCTGCHAEIGAFQHASVSLGDKVAFIGIDSEDTSRSDAVKMLRALPLSYPSYYDPSGHLGKAITDSSFLPVTVFYNSEGQVAYIRQGAYPTSAKLERDIKLYVLDA